MIAVDWVSGGLFVAVWVAVLVSILAVDAVHAIVTATKREISRRHRGDGIESKGVHNQ